MSERTAPMVNPVLALCALYKKDQKDFTAVLADVTKHLNGHGMTLDVKYMNDKVMPFVISLMFMSTCQEILAQYMQGLVRPDTRPAPAASTGQPK